MITIQNIHQIFSETSQNFDKKSIAFFQHQIKNNVFYKKYIDAIFANTKPISEIGDIPFLPIQFFKNEKIITNQIEKINAQKEEIVFESSGTTSQIKSKHFIQDIDVYKMSFMQCFRQFYGNIEDYCIMGLLPSYLERSHSSLVYMVRVLIEKSKHPLSNFYLYNTDELFDNLRNTEASNQKTILFGVSYALLDFAEKYAIDFRNTIVIETGGMKGRREEMIREEVHALLQKSFNTKDIHAEYGMTELLSQAYSNGKGIYSCPPWMKVLVRDINDPFQISKKGKGVLNVIDLANIHSCCFIATDDVGEVFEDGSFLVNGRLDNSELRGCSLMYENQG